MAENKKSFILYADLISVVTKLVLKDRENKTNYAGELFLTILEYVNDKEPVPIDFIVEMAFEPIKLTLKRDLKKYESYIEKQKVNGAKGGRPKKTEKTQAFLEKPKKADSVSDSVNDNEITTKEVDVDDIYKSYSKNYKEYATRLNNDIEWKNGIARTVIKHHDIEVCYLTIYKYLKLFLSHLDSTKEIHQNFSSFMKHFPNWLRKTNIELAQKPKEKIRYV